MNIPTCEGENPKANTGSNKINDLNNFHGNIDLRIKDTGIEIAKTETNIVSEDGIKVNNQNIVLCDPVKGKDPHVFYVINDVSTELLSPSKGSDVIVKTIQERDKHAYQNNLTVAFAFTIIFTTLMGFNKVENGNICTYNKVMQVKIKTLTNDSGLGSNIHTFFV